MSSQILKNMQVLAFVESMQANVALAIAEKPDTVFNIACDAHALQRLLGLCARIHREKPEWLVE